MKNILTKPLSFCLQHMYVQATHYKNICLCVPCEGEADHGSLQQQLNISANLTRQCVIIDITNDNETEENEFFQISISIIRYNNRISSISTVYSSTRIYQLHTQSATVTIIDDDCK